MRARVSGITWVFGFLAVSDAQVVFQYAFCICNSLQGFLIFLLHVVRDKESRDLWLKLLRCRDDEKARGKGMSRGVSLSVTSTEKKSLGSDVLRNKKPVLRVNDKDIDEVDDVERCRKISSISTLSERSLSDTDSSGLSPTPKNKLLDKCRKISAGASSVDTTISIVAYDDWDSPCNSIDSVDTVFSFYEAEISPELPQESD